MSEGQNKEIAHYFFDQLWNHANLSVIEEYVAPDFIEHFPGMENGREGFRKTAKLFLNAFPDLQLTIHDEVAEGDRVVHRWTWRATHSGELFGIPATGKLVEFDGMIMVRMANGQLVERWSRIDEVTLLRQLGVIPS
jgi:steroid delta-isomerase-like uncharacterized protein